MGAVAEFFSWQGAPAPQGVTGNGTEQVASCSSASPCGRAGPVPACQEVARCSSGTGSGRSCTGCGGKPGYECPSRAAGACRPTCQYDCITAMHTWLQNAGCWCSQGSERAANAAVLLLSRLCVQLSQQGSTRTCTDNSGLPISAIAVWGGCSVLDVFRELPIACNKLGPFLAFQGISVQQLEAFGRLQEWARTAMTLAALARKFKASCCCCYGTDAVSLCSMHAGMGFSNLLCLHMQSLAAAHLESLGSQLPGAMRLGWLLFLLLKPKLLLKFPDLVRYCSSKILSRILISTFVLLDAHHLTP